MIYGDHISDEDLALYAMRSLAPAETATVQQHLNTCGDCRGKLADILGDLSLVSLTVPQEPVPADARDRFMKRLRAESAAKPPEPIKPIRAPQEPTRSGNWFSGLGWAAAAAALLFAAYMGNTSHNLRQQLDSQRDQNAQLANQVSRSQQILDVLTSRTAKRVTLTEVKAAAQPTAHVIYEKDKGALIFVASDLRPVHADKTYELWLIPANGQAPIPAGLFRPDANGTASVVLPPLPTGVDAKAFGVTVEDAQGVTTPTLPIVMSGQ
ncbi:anti-sigma factor [Alloacidobacterium dinghuense]|uniref:Regulator of SigK n=1 Tax=Alloacidobacterium dinghuense TaxID=2763107 RepID=A0A7G8BNE0_9BACT|nr:anti-sigma factor [Alloacidobacterium dinghuense]QNI34060.1 anti-sigma factor [Alloacidobacterium dinghuense]